MDDTSPRAWASSLFGSCALGDPRRTRRLVDVAATLAERPAGTVTRVFKQSGAREGAYRLLESKHVSTQKLTSARDAAGIRQCASQARVFVAIDGSSLAFSNRHGARDVGSVGARARHGQGLLVTSALAVTTTGAPIDVCGQVYWARTERASGKGYSNPRRCMERETRHVVGLLGQVLDGFAVHAPSTTPWVQLDRGYDSWLVIDTLLTRGALFTIRAAHTRCLWGAHKQYLHDAVRAAAVCGHRTLDIPRRGGSPARRVVVDVKHLQVDLALRVTKKRTKRVTLHIVHAHEATPPAGCAPLSWTLMTSARVESLHDACVVLDGYAARWRIEELHRTWKTGLCHVEDTQLRSRDALVRWATLSCAVAARAQRLTHLARTTPTVPASTEFSRDEIDATIALKSRDKPLGVAFGSDPPLGDVVRWIADLGGYTGKSSGGPPGAIVIGRGLHDVTVAARAIAAMRRGDL